MDKRYEVSITLTVDGRRAGPGTRGDYAIIRSSTGVVVDRFWGTDERAAHEEAAKYINEQYSTVKEL